MRCKTERERGGERGFLLQLRQAGFGWKEEGRALIGSEQRWIECEEINNKLVYSGRGMTCRVRGHHHSSGGRRLTVLGFVMQTFQVNNKADHIHSPDVDLKIFTCFKEDKTSSQPTSSWICPKILILVTFSGEPDFAGVLQSSSFHPRLAEETDPSFDGRSERHRTLLSIFCQSSRSTMTRKRLKKAKNQEGSISSFERGWKGKSWELTAVLKCRFPDIPAFKNSIGLSHQSRGFFILYIF